MLNVKFVENQLFRSMDGMQLLAENYTIERIKVPTQFATEEDYQALKSTGTSVQTAMFITLIIPFVFLIFMSVSMTRVWALYNMSQLLINLDDYRKIALPGNLSFVLQVIKGMVYFKILDQPSVQVFLNNHVFNRMHTLQKILVGQGLFVTSSIFLAFAIAVVVVGLKVKALQTIFIKIKHKIMFSSVFRSQIQTYFPTCILVFTAFYEHHDIGSSVMQLLVLLALPIFSWFFLRKYQGLATEEEFVAQYGTLY
ncbi:MAG: hypothetical protein RL226_1737 [Bacteroidota bacterium]